ncbi:cysteine hydrolase [soil metagenome]
MTIAGLRFGELSPGTVHVAIDMQRLFAEQTEWASPCVGAIVPAVARIARHAPARTIFTRFLTPPTAQEALGQWRIYYERWASLLSANLKPELFDLVPALRHFVPPAAIVDKYAHSAFEAPDFQSVLDRLQADTIVFTGVETDVCVLATLLTAIDRGYRCILIADAIASSAPGSHAASMEFIFPRFDQQIEVIDTNTLLIDWAA